MKPLILSVLAGLVSLSAVAFEIDPRVLAVMRKEQSQTQNFCFSFGRDGIRNGMTVAQTCLDFSSARYSGNYALAGKTKDLSPVGDAISRAQGEFCASLGEYSKPGSWVRGDCEAWNRQRGDLFKLAAAGTANPAAIAAAIEKLEPTRRRFCQSLLQGGNAGDAQLFGSRINNCFAIAKLATAADRAILLGAF